MTLYAYRLGVYAWPTDDGQPWARFYGDTAPTPFDEIPAWLGGVIAEVLARRHPLRYPRDSFARVADRVTLNDADEPVAVLMPKVRRQHYLSASGAYELARDMRAFGAGVVVQRSTAITEWVDVDVVA